MSVLIVELPIDEDKQDYSYYNDSVKCDVSDENHGYEGKCTECGHYVIIMNNFMRSEVYGDVNDERKSLEAIYNFTYYHTED